jgi:transketolase
VLGMSTFGESAPMKVVMENFGFTVEHVVATAKKCMADAKAAN